MDHRQVARELLIAIRAHRSQVQWSRRLGYKSNVVYAWEAGRRWPTAAETFRVLMRAQVDVPLAIETFYGRRPQWLDDHAPDTARGVAAFLDDLRGDVSITDLARRSGLSRYSLTRWLQGATQPKLPEFLVAVDAASLRLVDFLAALVDPARLPSVAAEWERLRARREGAHLHPWTQAVLRALELQDYQALPRHEEGFIARRLGIPLDEERTCLQFLEHTGQVTRAGRKLVPALSTVDTRALPEVGQRLKAHWSRVGAERIEAGAPGQWSYNVFTVSRADLERIRELHLAYFRALRAIVAESEPGEHVAVANVQLFALDPERKA